MLPGGGGGRLVGWLVRRFTGPVVPFSEQGRSVALLTGGEPALVQEEIVRLVLHEIAYRILPREMALTGRPSVGAPAGARAAGGGPRALGR